MCHIRVTLYHTCVSHTCTYVSRSVTYVSHTCRIHTCHALSHITTLHTTPISHRYITTTHTAQTHTHIYRHIQTSNTHIHTLTSNTLIHIISNTYTHPHIAVQKTITQSHFLYFKLLLLYALDSSKAR